MNRDGKDVTKEFERGAEKALEICGKYKISRAVLKDGSPSCGSSYIYDGTFNKKRVQGDGVTSKLLKKRSIKVIDELKLVSNS